MIAKNNPFNIRNNRKNKWQGQIGSRKGFCMFSDLKYGVRAAAIIIRNYYEHGLVTPRQIITRFAPPSENDTGSYISFVCVSYLPADEPLCGDQQFVRLLERMSAFEGNPIPWLRISEILSEYVFRFPDYLKNETDIY